VGIWVVILEAVASVGERSGLGVEPGALDDLAEELAGHYAVVSERPWAYETELWVEEGTAGGAVLAAQFLWQSAVRYLGLPAWEVVRAEARDAHSLEVGIIDWPTPPEAPDDEASDEPPPLELATPEPAPTTRSPRATTGKKAATAKVGLRKAAPTKAAPTKAAPTKAAPTKAVTKKTSAPRAAAGADKAPVRKAGSRKAVTKKGVAGKRGNRRP